MPKSSLRRGRVTVAGAEDIVSRRPGIKDVARAAGVSAATVSNFLNWPERVSKNTRSRIQGAVDTLGYVRSESARQTRAKSSRLMGLIVLDMGNPFFVELARGAEAKARERDLKMMLCDSVQDTDVETEYLSLFAEHRAFGVIVSSADVTGRSLSILSKNGIPFVRVDRAGTEKDACSVAVDDVAGSQAAMRHLIEAGHRRLVYVSGPSHLKQIQDRRTGAFRAISDSGIGSRALREIPVDRLDVAAGRDAAARILGFPERPTAVFCANDLLALGMLQTFFSARINVPNDIALVGYDDIEFAAAAAVPLTSVRQPAAAIGGSSVKLLLQEASGTPEEHRHQHVLLQPELVVRNSSMLTL
ncbi:LacI family DNA-binding transcriptional regulator [Streptomyces shenzhenensis]|uniref:LacI family transcriptional regulator n=1 Tax=Streptomyces shenzhenensis TaxID=943815 RepID=A0A3M0I6Q2_9ACTN|nr:LacI family DNA-binding transcriptional regulator [Streptomyces shenzhenensis]RMB84877.1 LacI family transcriptional regulator [Streptomyces shenzhenensis]